MDDFAQLKELIITQYIKPTINKYLDLLSAVKKAQDAAELGKAVDAYKPLWADALKKDLIAHNSGGDEE